MDTSGVPHVTLDDPSNAKAIGKAVEERGAVVVHLREGDAVPLRATMDLPMAHLEAGKNVVRIDRDVWLYMSRKEARISADGRRWAAFGDLAGLKELFGMTGGTVQVGFFATEAEGAAFTFGIEGR
jgi:ABC-type hemin transport system substrate-binding protein